MRRIRLSMIVLALLAAMLLVPALGANAHAATTLSRSHISQATHPHQKVPSPDVSQVSCGWFHAVEIYNQGELCFENSGSLSVNIYNVTFILYKGYRK